MLGPLIVVLRGSGTPADVDRTTEALRAHTSEIAFDASVDHSEDAVHRTVSGDPESRGVARVVGAVEAGDDVADRLAWDLLRTIPDADVVLLQVGCAVGAEWRERLHSAAYRDAVIATASAVPASMLAIEDVSDANMDALASASTGNATLGEPLWGCVYVRRDALDIALAARSARAEAMDSPRFEEVVLVSGLVHVLASNVVVAATHRPPLDGSGLLTPAVRRALAVTEIRVEPPRVTVDLRCCMYPLSGTHVHALNLVSSLASTQELQLCVLLPARIDRSVRSHVDALPTSVTRLTDEQTASSSGHVFHRPYQLLNENEIIDVLARAPRLVLTHQDMILDRSPAYFPSNEHWRGYAAATALSLAAADEVAFFSEHARREAVQDDLVEPAKTYVVPPGTDHLDGSGDGVRPKGIADVLARKDPRFVLVLGTSYVHKNRVFAMRVADEMRRRYGWEGTLVFAGGKPGYGSSADDERDFLVHNPQFRARFVELGYVGDAERRWLYRHASLVLYPTLYEGFGLVPFEAGAAGRPCVYSSRSSVAEYLPSEGALIDLTNVDETAKRLSAVLESSEAADEIVHAIRLAGQSLTWERAAASYARIYRGSLERPVGLAMVTRGAELTFGARSQLAANETESRILFVSRRFRVVQVLARAAFAVALAVMRITHRR